VVAKRLVEAMGGVIGVDSQVGIGSAFWFELASVSEPTHADEATEVTPVAPAAAVTLRSRSVRTLLYVEDNPANMKLVEQVVARHAHLRLITAVNGDLGVSLARSELPDLILMDINLPGMSGLQALELLSANPATARIPVVAVSANAMPRDVERGLKAGFCAYLTKPIKVSEFMGTINASLELSEKPR
jgi:CheY-like chemotaxis protein